jgi:hypothetical protein
MRATSSIRNNNFFKKPWELFDQICWSSKIGVENIVTWK